MYKANKIEANKIKTKRVAKVGWLGIEPRSPE
jgi:hypothetical protein